MKLAFATGMRKGELLGLKWDDIYKDAVHVERSLALVSHIDKTGSRTWQKETWDTKTINSVRTIPLLNSTIKMLNSYHLLRRKYFLSKGLP